MTRLVRRLGAALGLGLVVATVATTAPALAAPPPTEDAVYLVTLKDGVFPRENVADTAAMLAGKHGGDVRLAWRDALHGFSATMTAAQAAALATEPSVVAVEPDGELTLDGTQPNPPSWGLDRIDQRTRPLNGSYNYPYDGYDQRAYVIDSGINWTHSDFRDHLPFGPSRAFPAFDALGGNGADCNGHGTHVAGTIGGTAHGVVKRARLYGVRVADCAGTIRTEWAVAGVNWVAGNAQRPAVVNMSLGGPADGTLDTAVRGMIATGGLTVTIAAGNNNANACNYSPARVDSPAALTVASSTVTDSRAPTSNWGSCADLFAPGEGIVSAGPSNGSATRSGTSMAAPHVAGVALMALQQNPARSPAQVVAAVLDLTTPNTIGNLNGTPNRLLHNQFVVPPINNPPVGGVTSTDSFGVLRGWARDPDGVFNPCFVNFETPGPHGFPQPLGSVVADGPGGSWSFVLPDSVRDGVARPITVTITEATAQMSTRLAPVTVTATRPPTPSDFDGDRTSDVSVYRPATGTWWIDGSTSGPYSAAFGLPSDEPVQGDFDADGRADLAVWRPADGTWHVQRSAEGYYAVAFGTTGDVPVAADWNGDGRTDVAVWRPSDATWYVLPTGGSGWYGVQFGVSTDVAVPADYDGDRKADIAVFRPGEGTWYIQRSRDGQVRYDYWGTSGDTPVPADYDRDGVADVAVFRPADGSWHVRQSLTGTDRVTSWGLGSDVVTPADYDGDSATDIAIFRPASGVWAIRRGSVEDYRVFGSQGDVPVPGSGLAAR